MKDGLVENNYLTNREGKYTTVSMVGGQQIWQNLRCEPNGLIRARIITYIVARIKHWKDFWADCFEKVSLLAKIDLTKLFHRIRERVKCRRWPASRRGSCGSADRNLAKVPLSTPLSNKWTELVRKINEKEKGSKLYKLQFINIVEMKLETSTQYFNEFAMRSYFNRTSILCNHLSVKFPLD